MLAIILAGGLGTRLRARVNDRPKALADVLGIPFLEYQLNWIKKSKIITRVIIAACYQADQISEYLKESARGGMQVEILIEPRALGTGGAIKNVIQQQSLSENILIMNGDTYYDFELDKILLTINMRKKLAMLICCKMDNQKRYGNLQIENKKVIQFIEKSTTETIGYVSAGLYLMHADYFLNVDLEQFSLEADFLGKLVSEDILKAHILEGGNRFYDIGTIEAYDKIKTKGF